jgi:DNA-binding CsgD family transcriptional regulator/tetratricopeptide (TPR) repeat protein
MVMLLERGTQLASLRQYAEEARARDGRLVLVSGEAGIGKSSLVEELQSELTDATWVWGACDGLFTPRPLAPLHDIAREVGGLLHEVVHQGAPRDKVYDEVLTWLDAQPRLTVMVVEDVQWADDATLDLLRYLGRRLRRLPVLVLVTFRDDAISPSGTLRVALGELGGQRSTRRIDLPPLSAEGVRRLAEGTSYPAEDLLRLTGGNPFFLVEVLECEDQDIPASIRDAVLARAAILGEQSREALEIAALDGVRVDAELVRSAAEVPLSTFDELVDAGLLTADGDALRFRHELSRRAVESTIPAHRRVAGHRALLDALDPRCDDDARMAYHAEGAGDATLVRRYAPAAAEHAATLGAHREAAAQFERALRFPPDDPRALAELYDGYADSLAMVDSWPQSLEARERAAAIWHELGDARREGYDHRKLMAVYWRLCRGAESTASAIRSIELLEPFAPDPQLALVLSARAFDLWAADPEAGQAMLERAREMAFALDDPAVQSDVLNNVAFGEFSLRQEWTASMNEALRLANVAGTGAQIGRAYANGYTFFAKEYRFAEGEHYWHDGIAYCDERDITTYGTCLRGHRAVALLDMGRWDEAEAFARGILAAEASPVNLLTSQITLALVLARRGLDGALDVIDPGVLAADGVEAEWVAATRLARAEVHWLQGDDDAARADLRVVREQISALDFHEDAALSVWEARLLGAAGPVSPAPEPWATWLSGDHVGAAAEWDRRGCSFHAAMTLHDSECDEQLRDAIARFEALGAEPAARRTRQRMKDLGHRPPQGVRASTRDHPVGLTRREDEVLALLCEGLTNEAIAERLVLSSRTVDHHVSAVLGKLGVSSRGAAVAQAHSLGLASVT